MDISKRNTGIDLLRFVLAFMVCLLHILRHGGVIINCYQRKGEIMRLIETFSFCAVNGYGLVSGYVCQNNKINIKRIVMLWLESFFYSAIITLLFYLFSMNNVNLSFVDIVKSCFPIINNSSWYMTAYFPLLFISPYIKKIVDKIPNKIGVALFFLIFIFFSLPSLFFTSYLNDGYSFLWLIVLFVLGMLIKKLNFNQIINKLACFIGLILSTLFVWIEYVKFGNDCFLKYTSPFILFNGIMLLLIFSSLSIRKESSIIIGASKTTLGIVLFQANNLVWNSLNERFCFVGYYRTLFAVPLIFLFALLLFILGIFVDLLREKIFLLLGADKLAIYISKKISQ